MTKVLSIVAMLLCYSLGGQLIAERVCTASLATVPIWVDILLILVSWLTGNIHMYILLNRGKRTDEKQTGKVNS